MYEDSTFEPLKPSTAATEPETQTDRVAVPTTAAPAQPAALTPPAIQPAPAGGRGPSRRRAAAGPGFVAGAVLASAFLASAGTYVVTNAGSHTTTSITPAASTTTTLTSSVASQGSVVDIVKAVSPAVVTIVAEGVTETDPTTGQTGTGHRNRLGRHLRRQRADPHQPPRRRRRPVEADGQLSRTAARSTPPSTASTPSPTSPSSRSTQTGLPTAPIGDSSTIQVGQQAIAIGSPLGQFTDSVTSGIISAIGRSIPSRAAILDQPDPDRHRHQPRQQRRPAARPERQGHRHQHRGRRRQPGHRLRDPDQHRPPAARPGVRRAGAARPWLGIRFATIDPTVKQADNLPVDNGAWIPTADALAGNGTRGQTGQDPNGQGNGGQGHRAGPGPVRRRPRSPRSSPVARPRRPASRRATSSLRSTERRSTRRIRSTSS